MNSQPLVGVLALQGDVREHARALEDLGARAVPVRRPGDLKGLQGLVLPGGESTTIDKLSRIFGLEKPLKELIAQGLPVYGSCAGLILLAQRLEDPAVDAAGQRQRTLGGIDMLVARNAFGRQRESFETDLEVAGLKEPVRAVFIRAPLIRSVGPDVQVLATLPEGLSGEPAPGETGAQARIVAVRSGNLLATSFHPEVTGERRIHGLLMELITRR